MKPTVECQRQILVLCLIAEKGVNPMPAWLLFQHLIAVCAELYAFNRMASQTRPQHSVNFRLKMLVTVLFSLIVRVKLSALINRSSFQGFLSMTGQQRPPLFNKRKVNYVAAYT